MVGAMVDQPDNAALTARIIERVAKGDPEALARELRLRYSHAPSVPALAEEERDAWMTPFDGSGIEWHEALPNPYTYQATDFGALLAAVHEYEAQVRELRNALEPRVATIRENVAHIARGCRASTSHNPAPYLNSIEAALVAVLARSAGRDSE
jgi:hypothetical protein